MYTCKHRGVCIRRNTSQQSVISLCQLQAYEVLWAPLGGVSMQRNARNARKKVRNEHTACLSIVRQIFWAIGRVEGAEKRETAVKYTTAGNCRSGRPNYKRRSVKWAVACLIGRCVRSVSCVHCVSSIASVTAVTSVTCVALDGIPALYISAI